MTEELVAIPKSEYEYLLRCKQQLEKVIQERIEMLNAETAIRKHQMQTTDIMTAIQTGCKTIHDHYVPNQQRRL